MPTCILCLSDREEKEFSPSEKRCKPCNAKRQRDFRKRNPDAVKRQNAKRDPQMLREQSSEYARKNPEKVKAARKARYNSDPERYRAERVDRYYQNIDAERERARIRQRAFNQTSLGRLRECCHQTARRMKNGAKDRKGLKSLPYGPDEFMSRLSDTLPNGVTMESALSEGWHIDHITPVSVIDRLDITDQEKFEMAMDLDNLRMLPAFKNRSRGIGSPDEWRIPSKGAV